MRPKEEWHQSTKFLIASLLIAGPLAIPLIWVNRKYSILLKASATIALLILSWYMMQASATLFDNLQQQMQNLKAIGKI